MPANAGDVRDTGLIPGLGRSPEVGTATCSSVLAWRIPWTGEPAGYGPQGRTESDETEVTLRACTQPGAQPARGGAEACNARQ